MSLTFVREFFRNPASVGAIWPSSRSLARAIVEAAGVSKAGSVIEIGSGNGVFTAEILDRKLPGAHFLAVEKSEALAEKTASKFPQARIVPGCATGLLDIMDEHDFPKPDAVVSGLPWAAFPQELQGTILDQITSALADGATFTTFAYFGPHRLRAGVAFRRNLDARFREVRKSGLILDNIPPAFVYVCRK